MDLSASVISQHLEKIDRYQNRFKEEGVKGKEKLLIVLETLSQLAEDIGGNITNLNSLKNRIKKLPLTIENEKDYLEFFSLIKTVDQLRQWIKGRVDEDPLFDMKSFSSGVLHLYLDLSLQEEVNMTTVIAEKFKELGEMFKAYTIFLWNIDVIEESVKEVVGEKMKSSAISEETWKAMSSDKRNIQFTLVEGVNRNNLERLYVLKLKNKQTNLSLLLREKNHETNMKALHQEARQIGSKLVSTLAKPRSKGRGDFELANSDALKKMKAEKNKKASPVLVERSQDTEKKEKNTSTTSSKESSISPQPVLPISKAPHTSSLEEGEDLFNLVSGDALLKGIISYHEQMAKMILNYGGENKEDLMAAAKGEAFLRIIVNMQENLLSFPSVEENLEKGADRAVEKKICEILEKIEVPKTIRLGILSKLVYLRVIRSQIKKGQLEEAYRDVSGKGPGTMKDHALSMIAKGYFERNNLEKGLQISQEIKNDSEREKVLKSQVEAYINQGEFSFAHDVTKKMKKGMERDDALKALSKACVKQNDLALAREVAIEIDDELTKNDTIAKVVAGYSEEKNFELALETVNQMKKGIERDDALKALSKACVKQNQLALAREVAIGIDDEFTRNDTIAEVVAGYSEEKKFELALETINQMKKGMKRDDTLKTLSKGCLEQNNLVFAKKAAEAIDANFAKSQAIEEIVTHCLNRKLLPSVFVIISEMKNGYEKDELAKKLAKVAMEKKDLPFALKSILLIGNSFNKHSELSELVTFSLAENQDDFVFEVASELKDGRAKDQALERMGNHFIDKSDKTRAQKTLNALKAGLNKKRIEQKYNNKFPS